MSVPAVVRSGSMLCRFGATRRHHAQRAHVDAFTPLSGLHTVDPEGNKVRSFILHRSLELYAPFTPVYPNALFSRRPANARGVGARTSHPPRAPMATSDELPGRWRCHVSTAVHGLYTVSQMIIELDSTVVT
eukprot:5009271-Prymnesium_polylepis.1